MDGEGDRGQKGRGLWGRSLASLLAKATFALWELPLDLLARPFPTPHPVAAAMLSGPRSDAPTSGTADLVSLIVPKAGLRKALWR